MDYSLKLGHNTLINIGDYKNGLYITANIVNTEECPFVVNIDCSNSLPGQASSSNYWNKKYKYKYNNMPENDELLNLVYLDLRKFTDQRKKFMELIM
uniref:Uncharacterized protein n=1 Tax=Pithovirus LCPAC102 TaxID=2506587 RepID=A0A481Z478_9VIRU|nr:MAG: hypothetical protein LCPAC102_01040 [Pithovirus LCPAC102]